MFKNRGNLNLVECLDFSKIPADILKQFEKLCDDYPPENVTCDGELSARGIKLGIPMLEGNWYYLELSLGMRVDKDKFENWLLTEFVKNQKN